LALGSFELNSVPQVVGRKWLFITVVQLHEYSHLYIKIQIVLELQQLRTPVKCEVRLCCYRKLQPHTRSFQSSHSQRHLNILMPITHYLTRNSPVAFGMLSFLNTSFCYDFEFFYYYISYTDLGPTRPSL
jgi:hypothetical protein